MSAPSAVEARTGAVRRRRTRRTAVAATTAAGVVLVTTLLDRVPVRRQADLSHVAFGRPFAWVVQDQGLTPPLPYVSSFTSPWESPTSLQVSALVLDLALAVLVVSAGWALLRALRARRRVR